MVHCPDASPLAFASRLSYDFHISSMIFHCWDWHAPKRREINGKLALPPLFLLPQYCSTPLIPSDWVYQQFPSLGKSLSLRVCVRLVHHGFFKASEFKPPPLPCPQPCWHHRPHLSEGKVPLPATLASHVLAGPLLSFTLMCTSLPSHNQLHST